MKQLLMTTFFWDKVTKTMGTCACIETVIFGSGKFEIPPSLAVSIGCITWAGLIIGHWVTDSDNDGIIDIAQYFNKKPK
jgi:hypothetical protein